MPPRCPVRPCPPSPAGRGGGCSRCSADPAPLRLGRAGVRDVRARRGCSNTGARHGPRLAVTHGPHRPRPEPPMARGRREGAGDGGAGGGGAGGRMAGQRVAPPAARPPARLGARRRRQQRTGIPALAQRKLALKRARYRKADDKKWEGRLT